MSLPTWLVVGSLQRRADRGGRVFAPGRRTKRPRGRALGADLVLVVVQVSGGAGVEAAAVTLDRRYTSPERTVRSLAHRERWRIRSPRETPPPHRDRAGSSDPRADVLRLRARPGDQRRQLRRVQRSVPVRDRADDPADG